VASLPEGLGGPGSGRPGRGGQTGRVASPVWISEPGDARLADYAGLTDVRLRRSLEAEHGLFIAEGDKVIRRAIAAGYPVRSFLVAQERLSSVEDLARDSPAPCYVVPAAVAERITGYQVHRGALAAMRRTPLPPAADVIAGRAARPVRGHGSVPEGVTGPGAGGHHEQRAARARRVIVLEDLVDHGNVGAIFRCAAALGIDAIILSPRCADPLYRRAIKVSMGAVFAIPYARMTDWRGGLAELRAAGFQLLALTPDQAAVPVSRVSVRERVALLLGTEGDGLSSRWLSEADETVCIPMAPGAMAAGVDSLNVVAAAAIACQALAGYRAPGEH
jgi:tRNA G18 (ribose-2'-O)-methylase SpoU